MSDSEVARLRRLRSVSLRVREVARSLSAARWTMHDPAVERGAAAAWRVARSVTGRLRGHPYAPYQQDAGITEQLANTLVATAARLGLRSRTHALRVYETHLRRLARQLDDARSLTLSGELSDSLGRSQDELRSILNAVGHETGGARLPPVRGEIDQPVAFAAPVEGDWPYLAF
jgi:hypothetical protein